MSGAEICASAKDDEQVTSHPFVVLGAAGAVCVGDDGEALQAARRRIERIVRAARNALRPFAPR